MLDAAKLTRDPEYVSVFRTIEISESAFERDGLRHVTVKSPSLGRRADLTLFIPPQASDVESCPLIVLLHGVYGSHWAWAFKAGAHITAGEMMAAGDLRPAIVAMPSDGLWGDGSGYLNHIAGPAHENWIMEDVVLAAREVSSNLTAASPLFLCGLSMGGYGALRLGLKHADRVTGISAHSSITHARQMPLFIEESLEFAGDLNDPELDPLHWARTNRPRLPALRFDCGTGDNLLQANRDLHKAFLDDGISHHYTEYDGAHSWVYWQQHLRDSLLFFERTLQK